MTDERVTEGLVEEMAADYSLDSGRLGAVLSEALDAYEDERDFWEWRDGEAFGHLGDIGWVLAAARTASDRWSSLSPEAREQVRFLQGGGEGDPVGPRLQFVVDMLDEYRVHYAKPRGNQGKARRGEPNDLRPLWAFAEVLVDFWSVQKGHPPGQVVIERHDADYEEGKDPVPLEPKSPGLKFICKVANLLPDAYEIANFVTVIRSIKEGKMRT